MNTIDAERLLDLLTWCSFGGWDAARRVEIGESSTGLLLRREDQRSTLMVKLDDWCELVAGGLVTPLGELTERGRRELLRAQEIVRMRTLARRQAAAANARAARAARRAQPGS